MTHTTQSKLNTLSENELYKLGSALLRGEALSETYEGYVSESASLVPAYDPEAETTEREAKELEYNELKEVGVLIRTFTNGTHANPTFTPKSECVGTFDYKNYLTVLYPSGKPTERNPHPEPKVVTAYPKPQPWSGVYAPPKATACNAVKQSLLGHFVSNPFPERLGWTVNADYLEHLELATARSESLAREALVTEKARVRVATPEQKAKRAEQARARRAQAKAKKLAKA